MSNIKTPLEVIEEGETVYRCNRVWEAWGMGTMSEDDFEEVTQTSQLDLLQALHDELEGKKIEQKETETWDTELKTIVYGRRLEIQDQQDNLQALIKKI